MRTRIEFRTMLKEAVGENVHLYFMPPEGQALHYPCIIYSRANPSVRHADDKKYVVSSCWDLMFITTEAEDCETVEKLMAIRCSRPGKPYPSNGLYHYPFTITF